MSPKLSACARVSRSGLPLLAADFARTGSACAGAEQIFVFENQKTFVSGTERIGNRPRNDVYQTAIARLSLKPLRPGIFVFSDNQLRHAHRSFSQASNFKPVAPGFVYVVRKENPCI